MLCVQRYHDEVILKMLKPCLQILFLRGFICEFLFQQNFSWKEKTHIINLQTSYVGLLLCPKRFHLLFIYRLKVRILEGEKVLSTIRKNSARINKAILRNISIVETSSTDEEVFVSPAPGPLCYNLLIRKWHAVSLPLAITPYFSVDQKKHKRDWKAEKLDTNLSF